MSRSFNNNRISTTSFNSRAAASRIEVSLDFYLVDADSDGA